MVPRRLTSCTVSGAIWSLGDKAWKVAAPWSRKLGLDINYKLSSLTIFRATTQTLSTRIIRTMLVTTSTDIITLPTRELIQTMDRKPSMDTMPSTTSWKAPTLSTGLTRWRFNALYILLRMLILGARGTFSERSKGRLFTVFHFSFYLLEVFTFLPFLHFWRFFALRNEKLSRIFFKCFIEEATVFETFWQNYGSWTNFFFIFNL